MTGYDPYVRAAPVPPLPPPSAIPKVIGILAIVFSSLGILASLAITFGVEDELRKLDATNADLGGFRTWMLISFAISAAIFGVHLTAGIQSVRYAPSAPRLMTTYAIMALVLFVAELMVSEATFPNGTRFMHKMLYEELVYPRFGLAVLALPWPIVALVLMNQRSARAACVPKPSGVTAPGLPYR